MKKINSLKRNEEIAKIVHNKQFVRNDVFLVYYQDNSFDYSRICISVSKKLGIAVIRNKTKRQIREIITKNFDFEVKKDYVIIVKPTFLDLDFQTKSEKLKSLYLKINPNKE